jgi:predicted nucleic acid-binding protein
MRTNEKLLHLSVLTLGEIRKGVTLLPASRKRADLELWLGVELPTQFAERLLPINSEIAEIWCAMAGQAQLTGVTIGIVDGLIAATAKHHGLTLVTRNVRDFKVWDMPIENPGSRSEHPARSRFSYRKARHCRILPAQ